MEMKRYSIMVYLLALSLIVGFGMTGAAVAEGKQGGTLVILFSHSPRHLNPAVMSGTQTMIPGAQIFAAPLRYDDK